MAEPEEVTDADSVDETLTDWDGEVDDDTDCDTVTDRECVLLEEWLNEPLWDCVRDTD